MKPAPLTATFETPRPPMALLLLAALGLIGSGLFFYSQQLRFGLAVTGLNSQVTWGIYIVNFIFCVGLSAGGIAVSALVHAFHIEELKPVALIAEILALTFLLLAAVSIVLDMGHPERGYFIPLHANPRSPLVWDVTVITTYLILCLALLWSSLRSDLQHLPAGVPLGRALSWVAGDRSEAARKSNTRLLQRLSVISIPVALALHSVTAWILGLAKGQPGWNTAILAPLFIASALVSGIGVVVLGSAAVRSLYRVPLPDSVTVKLGRYLFLLLPILAYLLFSEFLTISYTGGLSHQRVMEEIVWGRFAGVFWFDVIVGLVIPFLILTFAGRSQTAIQVASLMAVVGVLAERVNILLPSLMRFDPLRGDVYYFPTAKELTMVSAVYAGGLLFFLGFGALIGRLETQASEHHLEVPAKTA